MPPLVLLLYCQLSADEPIHEVLLRGYYAEVQRFEGQVESRWCDIVAEPESEQRDAKLKVLRQYWRDCEALLRQIWIHVRRSPAKAKGLSVDLAGT